MVYSIHVYSKLSTKAPNEEGTILFTVHTCTEISKKKRDAHIHIHLIGLIGKYYDITALWFECCAEQMAHIELINLILNFSQKRLY